MCVCVCVSYTKAGSSGVCGSGSVVGVVEQLMTVDGSERVRVRGAD